MKVLFLGLFFDEEGLQQSYKKVRGGMQIAPHKFQTLLIDGLQKAGVEVSSAHVLPCGTFPKNHKSIYISDKRWGRDNLRVGYLNLPFIKQRTQERKVYRYLKEALSSTDAPQVIVVYYLHPPFWKALLRIKKQFPKIKILLIMTESVPGRGDIVDTPQRKKLGDKMVSWAKIADGFCLLTKYLTGPLEVGERRWMTLEGVADQDTPSAQLEEREKGVFLYTGGVFARFNVDNLIKAFAYLPEGELWLCGKAEESQEMKKLLRQSPNVRYFGEVPHDKLQEYRKKCSYLINPRMPTGTYTKYSFPSKTMEYLASGKPALGYALEGMGEEYRQYLTLLNGKAPQELAEELRAILETDYAQLEEKAMLARDFILTNKTAERQAARLARFLEEL